MKNATLAIKVRMLLERGRDLQYIYRKLQEEGYTKKEIKEAMQEYIKDEQTNYDERLIETIEERYRSGKRLDVIFEELIKEGHPPFEIEKALLRSFKTSPVIHPSLFVWKEYTIHMFFLFLATLLVGYFISPFFFLAAFSLANFYGWSLLLKKKNKNYWTTEIEVLPFTGLWITQGYFGYNGRIGNYFRWWIIDPALLSAGVFLLIMIYGYFFLHSFWVTFSAFFFLAWALYIWGIPENEKPF